MKLFRWLTLYAVLMVSKSEARPLKEPRTVLDFFDLLPKKFFEIEYPGSKTARRKWLRGGFKPGIPLGNRAVIDLKNDYLRASGDGAQGRLDLAVFRYHGKAILGVYDSFEEGDLSFWRYKNGRLSEVTQQVLPPRLAQHPVYDLPRVGTTIRVFRSANDYDAYFKPGSKPIYSLKWSGGRFQREN